MLVRVDLGRILIREMTDTQFITLVECEGGRSFPIAIGLPEAFAIERRLKGIDIARRTVVKYREQLGIPPARRRKIHV